MRKLSFLVLFLGLVVFTPVLCYGLTPQEREDLVKFSTESKSIQKLLLVKLQESEKALMSARTYSEELESQRQELIGQLDELNKKLEIAERLLKDSVTITPDLMNGFKAIENERDIWRVVGISGAVVAAVLTIASILGGPK